jgi:hypothetical protein
LRMRPTVKFPVMRKNDPISLHYTSAISYRVFYQCRKNPKIWQLQKHKS